MKTVPVQGIPELLVLEPTVFSDDRGFFYESWNRQGFLAETGVDDEFVQDNHSRSTPGVLRGVHYQIDPEAQGKLVRCVRGTVWDVAVDLRRSSPTFKTWFGLELSESNRLQLWIPEGFGHGFVARSQDAEVLYKTTAYYSPEHDRSVRWDDPEFGIDWQLDGEPIVSEKDASAPYLRDADVFA